MKQAATILRGIIGEVAAGRLSTGGPNAAGLVRRIEGAAVALDVASRRDSSPSDGEGPEAA